MARLVTRSELARLAGVSPAAITKACRKQLRAAQHGKLIDLDHPASQQYLNRASALPTEQARIADTGLSDRTAPRPRPALERPPDAPPSGSTLDLEELTEIIQPVLDRFGTETNFKTWLFGLKTIEEIRQKRLQNEEQEGRLVEREFVKTHVFGHIEAANRRLLSDSPKTIARRIYALAKSGAAVEEAEATIRDLISSQLKPARAQAVRALRHHDTSKPERE